MTATATKPWFRINKDVEYSTDFKFFVENQIFVSKSGIKHSFCSRLEAKTFRIKQAVTKSGQLSDMEIELEIKLIHQEILRGEHGKGTFVE